MTKNSQKKATESLAIQTKMVLPNDTNPLNTLFGGRLLEWMDEIASISWSNKPRSGPAIKLLLVGQQFYPLYYTLI